MRISLFAPLALGLCLLLPACQQADTAKPQLAVVDMARIMRDSEPGKAGVKFLEGIQAEMQSSLNDIQSRLQKNPNDAQAQKELQTIYMAAQQRMQTEQQNVINVLYDMVQRVINGYRTEKGYAVILNSEAAAAYDAKADVTADIVAAVKSGKLSVKDLDTCVRRVLELVVKTKRFAGVAYDNKPDLTAHAQVTRQGAAEGAVLLKNNGGLPFTHVKNVALYGCGSYDLVAGGTGSGNVNRAYTISLVEGMRNAGYNVDVDLINEYTPYIEDYYKKNPKPGALDLKVPTLPSEKDVKVTDEEVSRNDIAVITLHRISGEGADRTIAQYNLEDNEKALIKNVCDAYHKAGKKVVVVLNIGGAIETASWKNEPDAILVPWQCGQEIGNSIADLLSGKATPSGKLSMTWPVKVEDDPSTANFPANTSGYSIGNFNADASKQADVKNIGYTDYDEDIYVGYRYYDTFKKNVSYPFGYGLSYTTFDYSDVKAADNGNDVTVTVTITNTGKQAGKEVAEVYVTAPKGKVEKPAQELKAFAKTRTLQPGESQTLTMTISKADLASFVTAQSAWVADAGTYTFKVGASSRDIKGTATLNLKGLKKKVSNALAPKVKLNLLTQK